MAIQRSETNLDVNGKELHVYIASPTDGGPGILVLPSWWGLKPFFQEVCDQLAEHGYTALTPDYYQGRVATTIDEAKVLQGQVEGDMEAMAALVSAAKEHLLSLRAGAPVGIVGFSMGTDWALMTAAKEPRIAAVVLFYGLWGGMDFSTMRCKVQGHFAEHDEWQPMDQVQAGGQKMKAQGVDATLYFYPGTAHWFMESDRPEYDPAAAALAWQRTYDFLEQNLK